MTRHFHVLVVGAGPAGMAAATRAAESGAHVGLVDDNPNPGGQIWRSSRGETAPDNSHGGGAAEWYRRLSATSAERLQGWSIFAHPAPNRLLAESQSAPTGAQPSGETLDLTFDKLILATGARERFLPFPGWTLPNVMGVGGLQALWKSGLPVAGKRIVLAGSGPLLLAVAATLKGAGATVVCICEQSSKRQLAPFALSLLGDPARLSQGIRYKAATLGVPFHTGSWPIEARGDTVVRSVVISDGRRRREIPCDYLACAFHLIPNLELPALIGCTVEHDTVIVDHLQRTSVPNVFCAGEPTGIGGLELSLIEGEISGLASAGDLAGAAALVRRRRPLQGFSRRLAAAFALRPELRELCQSDTLVCRCEDVPFSALATEPSWRAAKLHTRCGMGPCQGRVCGAATSFLFGWPQSSEAQSIRPPILPSSIASLTFATPTPPLEISDKQEIV